MAAPRRNAMNIAEAREKIRTTQLINRLSDHALGKIDMSPTQVQATSILLKKTLPDLEAVEHSGETTQRIVTAEPPTEQEWQAMYGPPASDAMHD